MGAVYRAHDTELGRDVAVKVVLDDTNPELAKRMRREARAASAFAHPNVASIFDVSEHQSRPFIVMELVLGSSLRSLLAEGELDQQQKLDILTQVARALAAAHDRGLVHRDVKPDNIMVRADGVAKLLDFGIAKANVKSVDASAPTEDQTALTKTGATMGSPAYMAPEQIQNGKVDERADQFAWAVTAFELLAGELPWKSKGSAFEVAASILHEPPIELASLCPGLPEHTLEVVTRALSKSASNRFEDMHALLEAMDSPALEPKSAATAATGMVSRASRRRTPWMPISLGVAALFGGLILLQHLATYDDKPPPAPARVVLGLNDELTLREQEANAPVPKTALPSASAVGKPAIVLCPDAGNAACLKDNRAWCDASGKLLACCVEGLVARADGRCECAPGGVTSPELQKSGCAAPKNGGPAEIQRRVRHQFGTLRACYDTAQRKNANLEGTIGVRFHISPDGLVYDATISTNVPDPTFQSCVVAVFETFVFEPPADGDTVVTYPIVFHKAK